MGQRRAGTGLRVLELGGHHEAAVIHEPGMMVPSFSYNYSFFVVFILYKNKPGTIEPSVALCDIQDLGCAKILVLHSGQLVLQITPMRQLQQQL